MREIKFRGLRTDGKGWVYGYLFMTTHNTASEMCLKYCIQQIHENNFWYDTFEVTPESVGQFTGLTDKNGKDIYEGDILSHHDYSKGACLTFEQFKRTSNIIIDNLFDGIRLYGTGGTYTKKDKESFEIIGNIHETP